jgi:hypothetical protein
MSRLAPLLHDVMDDSQTLRRLVPYAARRPIRSHDGYMMSRQPPLFSATPTSTREIALAIPGSAPALSRAQKKFNKLVDEVSGLRRRLSAWREYETHYRQRVEQQMIPLEARLRESRFAIVVLLDATILGKGLTRREKSAAREMLADLVLGLMEDGEANDELRSLADRHGLIETEEDRHASLDALREMSSDVFGIDLDPQRVATTSEELLQRLSDDLAAEEARRDARRKARPKSAKVREREAQAERFAADAGQALREVYRKLARELHPDRIADEDERTRKTALMQDANRAYEAGDLLSLLELQLRIEQIDPDALTSIAEEKLAHFNHVLAEQAKCLHEEVHCHAAPFFVHLEGLPRRDVEPAHIDRALDRHAEEMQHALSSLQVDLARFADPAELKRELREFAQEPAMDDLALAFDALAQMIPHYSRSRRTRRKRKSGRG